MRATSEVDLPPEKQAVLAKARRLEWITLFYLTSAAALMYVTMGASQAMRTSFVEDLLSLVPAAAFLICNRICRMPPSEKFPYGLHGSVSIGYLVAALALFTVGFTLLVEAATKLASGERTTIGGMNLFGVTLWAGWPMLAALAYATVPSVFLGRAKLRLAPQIHDKILYADAQMMKADWMTAVATAVGVLGVGFGYWWLDPLAAALVSLDILKDGATNLWVAVADLIQRRPMRSDRSAYERLPDELKRRMEALDWVDKAEVRLRESGHVFFGEVLVVPRTMEQLPARIRQATEDARLLTWRFHDLTITAVHRLDGVPS